MNTESPALPADRIFGGGKPTSRSDSVLSDYSLDKSLTAYQRAKTYLSADPRRKIAATRAARKARALTQAELAEAVSRTVEAISNIERGISLPPLDLLQRIAETLKVPLVDLLEPVTGSGALAERAMLEMEVRQIAARLDIETLRVAVRQIAALKGIAELRLPKSG